jgi:CRISPR-associated protein Cmr3
MVPDRAMKMDKRWESSSGWFLTIDGMKAWLAGGVPDLATIVCRRKVWVSESRTGVGLTNDRRRHEEHQLYTFGFIRLQKDVSLGFELSGGELPCGVVARFGGENRAATIERGPLLSDLFAERSGDSRGDRCTLTLLTPAIFSDGAFPKQGAVRSAVVPGPVLAGGWDLARRRPKPLRRAAPAGSVYWIDEDVPSILGPWEQQHRDAKEGFGLALAGQQPRRQRG